MDQAFVSSSLVSCHSGQFPGQGLGAGAREQLVPRRYLIQWRREKNATEECILWERKEAGDQPKSELRGRPELSCPLSCVCVCGGGVFQGDLETPEPQLPVRTMDVSYLTGMQGFSCTLLFSSSLVR